MADELQPCTITTREVIKTDSARRLVFGFAIICKDADGEHDDLQDEHVPEDVMFDAGLDFALNSRVAKEMHGKGAAGDEQVGTYPFIFPLTTEIAAALDIQTEKTGLLVAAQFDQPTFDRFESGELTGFSIGGEGLVIEEEIG